MRMLATGQNVLPAKGVGAVSDQIADGLPAGSVRLDARATAIEDGEGGAKLVKTAAGRDTGVGHEGGHSDTRTPHLWGVT